MSKIRSARTGFEKKFFGEIRKRGVRFREDYAGAMGKPDIALPRERKAVFLHSDFWHGWQLPRWEKILPNDFWKNKLNKNRARDKKVVASLRRQGWDVMVVWEHTYNKKPDETISRIVKFLKK